MYYIDTPSAQIDAMDFTAGEVSNRRAVVKGFDFETTGFPDGSLAYGEEMGRGKVQGGTIFSSVFDPNTICW